MSECIKLYTKMYAFDHRHCNKEVNKAKKIKISKRKEKNKKMKKQVVEHPDNEIAAKNSKKEQQKRQVTTCMNLTGRHGAGFTV